MSPTPQTLANMSINNILRFIANSTIPGNEPIPDSEKPFIHDLLKKKEEAFINELDSLFNLIKRDGCEGKSFKTIHVDNGADKLDAILNNNKVIIPKNVINNIKTYNPTLVRKIELFQTHLATYKRTRNNKKPKIPHMIKELLDCENYLDIDIISKIVRNVPAILVKKIKIDESKALKLATRIVKGRYKREKGTHAKNTGYSIIGENICVRDIGGIAQITTYGPKGLDEDIKDFMIQSPVIETFNNIKDAIQYKRGGSGGYNAIHMDVKLNRRRRKLVYENIDTVELQITDVESFLEKEIPGTRVNQTLYKQQQQTNFTQDDKDFIEKCSAEILSVLQYK